MHFRNHADLPHFSGQDSDPIIKIYLREIMQTPLLSPQEEIELAARIKKGDREARALMIKANLRLVVKIAHDYAHFGLPLKPFHEFGEVFAPGLIPLAVPGERRRVDTKLPRNE
jgi:hypothetical protein